MKYINCALACIGLGVILATIVVALHSSGTGVTVTFDYWYSLPGLILVFALLGYVVMLGLRLIFRPLSTPVVSACFWRR